MRRISELDGLRGIAAAVIVLFHWRFHFKPMASAVDLFFVLSGYLITTVLLGSIRRPGGFRVFYARRALRIFPIYYLTFAVFLVVNRFGTHPAPLDALPYYLTYTQCVHDYFGVGMPPFSRAFGHLWTLAIEEQFYLIWPLLVWWVGRRGLFVLAPALMAMSAVFRVRGMPNYLLLSRCDGLVLGALLAAILADHRWVETRRARLIGALALAAILAALPIEAMTRGSARWSEVAVGLRFTRLAVLYTGLVGAVVLSSGRSWLRPLRAPWLVAFGMMSYGLYLYHIPIFRLVEWTFDDLKIARPMLRDLTKLAMSLSVAALSWRFVERPLLALKDRVRYAPGAETPPLAIPSPHVRPARTPSAQSGSRADCARRVS